MTSHNAVRFVMGGKTATGIGALHFQLHVKPGTNKARQGITSLRDECIEMCVAAQARDGEANKAVLRILCEALGLPKSRVELTRGLKSRNKTVVLSGVAAGEGPGHVEKMLELLRGKGRTGRD